MYSLIIGPVKPLFYEDLIAKNPLVFSDEKTLVTSTPT